MNTVSTVAQFKMFLPATLITSLLVSIVLGAPAHLSEPAVKHAWTQVPDGWEVHSTPDSEHPITLKIGLKQSRIHDLIDTLYEVSDPLHQRYGQHLSRLYGIMFHIFLAQKIKRFTGCL